MISLLTNNYSKSVNSKERFTISIFFHMQALYVGPLKPIQASIITNVMGTWAMPIYIINKFMFTDQKTNGK